MANPGKVLGVLGALWAGLALLAWGQGGYWFSKHETDMLHLIDIVTRRTAGDLPHLDFMTPLGLWAFEPFVLLHGAGLGLGHALAFGQVALAAVVLGPAWYVGVTRFDTIRASLFGAGILLLICALVYGGTDPKLSLSMHYNRWAWALVFLPLTIAALPRKRGSPWMDGLITGLVMAALAMIKVTYFAGFAPAVIAGLALRRDGRALGTALGIGLMVVIGVTLAYGMDFWRGYLADTLTVASSKVRAAPGDTFAQVLLASRYIGVTALALGTLVMLRHKARNAPILPVMALMFLGATYVTWQNYGNDPLWLLLWSLLLFSLPEAARGWKTAPLAGGLAIALIAPVAFNIAWSPVRALIVPASAFARLFPDNPARDDIYAVRARMNETSGQVPLYRPPVEDECQLTGGFVAWLRGMSDELEEAQLSGSTVYVADLFNFLWLFGDFERLRHGAPWHYAGLPGFDEADILVVPKCPVRPGVTRRVLTQLETDNVTLIEDFESERMTVYQIAR